MENEILRDNQGFIRNITISDSIISLVPHRYKIYTYSYSQSKKTHRWDHIPIYPAFTSHNNIAILL